MQNEAPFRVADFGINGRVLEQKRTGRVKSLSQQ